MGLVVGLYLGIRLGVGLRCNYGGVKYKILMS